MGKYAFFFMQKRLFQLSIYYAVSSSYSILFETINCYRHHSNNVVSVTYIGSVLFKMIHRSIHAKESEF